MESPTMIGSKFKIFLFFIFLTFLFFFHPEKNPAREIPPSMESINQFSMDRIVFHSIHNLDKEGNRKKGSSLHRDTSLATLVVILGYQTYIFRDGYDHPREVMNKEEAYKKNLVEYRVRQNFLKDYRELKNSPDNPNPNKYNSIFLKYDPIYRAIYQELQLSLADEYRNRRFHGENSPKHKESIQKKEELNQELKTRYDFLVRSLDEEENQSPSHAPKEEIPPTTDNSQTPRASTPLPKVYLPEEEDTIQFYSHNQDGKWDYFSYSQTPRTLDYEVFDKPEESFVHEKYGSIADTILQRLLEGHAEKLKNAYFYKNEFGSRVYWDNCNLDQKKGIRLILITSDDIRYNLEDCNGDGKVETWEVHNQSLPFRYANQTANIISITNCNQEKYCKFFENLLVELQSAKNIHVNSVRSRGKDIKNKFSNEDELLKDWELLFQSLPNN